MKISKLQTMKIALKPLL